MSPEMLFAQSLGSLPTQREKLAARMDALSIEELEAILVGGKTKTAFGALAKPPSIPSPMAAMARPQLRGAGKAASPPLKTTSPMPMSPTATPSAMPSLMKGASVKVKLADQMGRVLARRSMEKTALPGVGAMVGMGLRTAVKAKPLMGAGVGAALGAGRYALSNDPNKSLLGNVAGGAALGAGAASAASGGARALAKGQGSVAKATRGAMREGGAELRKMRGPTAAPGSVLRPATAAPAAATPTPHPTPVTQARAVGPGTPTPGAGATMPAAPQAHPAQIAQLKAQGLSEAEIAGRVKSQRGLPAMAPTNADLMQSRALSMQTTAQGNSAQNAVARSFGGGQGFTISDPTAARAVAPRAAVPGAAPPAAAAPAQAAAPAMAASPAAGVPRPPPVAAPPPAPVASPGMVATPSPVVAARTQQVIQNAPAAAAPPKIHPASPVPSAKQKATHGKEGRVRAMGNRVDAGEAQRAERMKQMGVRVDRSLAGGA